MNKKQKQEMVEFVAVFMVNQGAPGYNHENGGCRYMTHDGLRCAIGCMLSEDECRRFDSLETETNVRRVVEKRVNGWSKRDLPFLEDLQDAHDYAAEEFYAKSKPYSNGKPSDMEDGFFIKKFSSGLEGLCEIHNLRFPEELI